MKQVTITLFTILFSLTVFSQDDKKQKEPKHEIGLDILDFAEYKLSLSYNHLLNKKNSIGVNISIYDRYASLGNMYSFYEVIGVDFNYKHYFSKNHTQGFYVESFAKYSFGQANDKYNENHHKYIDFNAISLGLGIGYKHVFSNNLYINMNLQVSQNLNKPNLNLNNRYSSYPATFLHRGISIGKRF